MQSMNQSNVVKFPTRRVVRRRTFVHYLEDLGSSRDRLALEAAYNSVSHAIEALRRQQSSLLLSLRHAARQDAEDRLCNGGAS